MNADQRRSEENNVGSELARKISGYLRSPVANLVLIRASVMTVAVECSTVPRTIDFATVRKIGLEFPGVEEGTMFRAPALKLRGKLLACVPTHRSAEPGSLVICIDFADRAALLAEAPDLYYLPDHYVGYPSILVRLSRVTPAMLRDLLGMAYKFVIKSSAPKPRKRQA